MLFRSGSIHRADETRLNLSALTHADAAETAVLLKEMPELVTVDLGSDGLWSGSEEGGTYTVPADIPESDRTALSAPAAAERDLTWEDIRLLQEAAPGAAVCFRFSLFGKSFTTLDEEMNFHHVTMEDEGAAVREVLPCMTHCRVLDMDFSGVSSESMAQIRDDYPEMEVIWRIWFGNDCSVRTDTERILASNLNHVLTDDNTQDLKYCTKLRLLDIGHNSYLTDFGFLEHMPDLEVAILGVTGMKDLHWLAQCTKLEYLELNTLYGAQDADLAPLENLTALQHLNLCRLGHVKHWEVLRNMTGLRRLYFGRYTWLPDGAREELEELFPDTEINWTLETGCDGPWRFDETGPGGYAERYALLREQFEYSNYTNVSSSWYNDPLYYREGETHYRPWMW